MQSRFHVLGRGAIGLLVSSALFKKSLGFSLIVRNPRPLSEIVQVSSSGADDSPFPVIIEGKESSNKIENLLVTAKVHQTIAAIKSVSHRLVPSSSIVLFQNGVLSILPMILAIHPNIILASTTLGAYKKEMYEFVQTGQAGETIFNATANSPAISATMSLLSNLTLLNPKCYNAPNDPKFTARLLQKVAVNAVINPISALLNIRNGQINWIDSYIVQNLSREISDVYHAKGWVDPMVSCSGILDAVDRVARITEDNFSSMCVDVNSKERETEIDHINGWIIDLSEEVGCKVPITRSIVEVCFSFAHE